MNHDAIYKLNPSVVTIRGDKAYDINDNEVIYDKAAVNAWVDPEIYKYQRAKEYPSFAEQFDTLYHGGYDAWKAQIDAIKLKYPKV
jgi:hypothetical protein